MNTSDYSYPPPEQMDYDLKDCFYVFLISILTTMSADEARCAYFNGLYGGKEKKNREEMLKKMVDEKKKGITFTEATKNMPISRKTAYRIRKEGGYYEKNK